MVDKLSNYILDNLLYKNEKVSGDEREIMLFGITRIIEDVPKYTLLIIISILLGILKEVAIVFLITAIYKICVGGAHARTNIGCLFFSTLYFISPVFIAKYINIDIKFIYAAYILVFIFSIYVILKIVPADTEEIPILNKKKRRNMKIISFINLILLYVVAFTFKNDFLIKVILVSVFYIDLMATKPAYKLFKCKYSFESEEYKDLL